MPIKVYVTDDHTIVREGIISLLVGCSDIEVVGSGKDCRQTLEEARKSSPDVVVLDIGLPHVNGIECLHRLKHKVPSVKVLMLSMYETRSIVLSSLRAGADGYLLKDCATEELERAVRCIAAGQTYVCPAVAGYLTEEMRSAESTIDAGPFEVLTEREREVLQLYAEGYSTNEIAERLNLSSKTVSTHRLNLNQKLDLKNVAEMTRYAIREGLTSVE